MRITKRGRRRHYTKKAGVHYGRPKGNGSGLRENLISTRIIPFSTTLGQEMSFVVGFYEPSAFLEAKKFFGGRTVVPLCDFVRWVHKANLKPLY